jgi:putative sigma-54 modulation protein
MPMKVRVQSVNFNVDQDLINFIDSKINNLERFYDKIIDAEVFLKVQKTSEKENKMADIKLNIAGDELIVKKQCKSFEESVDLAVDSLRRQLNKKKDKLRAHY